jgi:hypothetical protein
MIGSENADLGKEARLDWQSKSSEAAAKTGVQLVRTAPRMAPMAAAQRLAVSVIS